MGNFVRVGPDLSGELSGDQKPLSDAEIDAGLRHPIGETSGVMSIRMDANGNAVAVNNQRSSQSVVLSGGPPTNLHQTEIKQLQNELLGLYEQASQLPEGDLKRAQMAARALELEAKAKQIKAKEEREIESSQQKINGADEGTMRSLREALADTQRDAAERKERGRGKLML